MPKTITSNIIRIEILTATSDMLRKLQQVYPTCEIIDQLLSLFEILAAYSSSFDSKDRIAAAESCENILKELINIAKTLEPYLDPETEHFSDEDREKIKDLLSFNPDYALTLLEDPRTK